MLLRLPGQGNQDLTVISATSTGEWKLHFECESRYNENLYNVKLNFDIPIEFMEKDNLLSIKIDDLIKNKMFAEENLINEVYFENKKFLIYDLIEQLLPLPSKAIYTINSHYIENDCVNFYLEDSLIISQLSREDFLGIYDFYPIYPN